MAQEDKGLVIRGLLLLSAIGVLVLIVLSILFWRPQAPTDSDVTVDGAPSAPGWDIRYNAAATLARRGSDKVPWSLLREMLDAKQQWRNNRVTDPDGREVVDEAAARATTLSALRALAAWHEKRKADNKTNVPAEVRELYAIVDKLTESPYVELKVQAEKARATFFR